MKNKYKPIPFWSWNDELDEKELANQIQWMHDSGIGGFFMHARGGLTTPYLGDKWFRCVEACLKKAKELDMEAYAYDENGWPSGFAGGLLIQNEEDRNAGVIHKYGKYDPKAAASFKVEDKTIKRVFSGDDVMNVYVITSTTTADVQNKDVVKKFIELTHEQYKKHDIYGNLRGFFTDEPQYFRWMTPFTRVLPDYFKEHYHEDVFDRIGLLFVDKEGYEDYRYKYYKANQDLLLNAFAKQIYDWCDKNNYKLTGHYVLEETMGYQIIGNGGVMPFYEYEHIPGVDHLGRNINNTAIAKQLGSVMSQLNKRQGLCEMFACAGWDATPLELKRIAELYMWAGINVICHHLLPYSEHGQRKRDYPEHYSAINPWVEKGFRSFNDFFSNISTLLAESTEIAEVGLFEPIRSAYFHYHREQESTGYGVKELDDNFIDINQRLVSNGVPYHILDEVIMSKHGHVENGTLIVGCCKYKYIIIPKGTLTMDKSTMELFREYVSNGGKIYIEGDKPSYLEGHRYDHDYLNSNIDFNDILESKPYKSSFNENIRLAYRQKDTGEKFIYAINFGDETDINLKVEGYRSFVCDDKVLPQHLHFNKGESKILYFSNKTPEEDIVKEVIKLGNKFEIIGDIKNYLTLDFLQYSKDGVTYSNKMPYMAVFNLLLEDRYEGDLFLKYEFDVKEVPKNCELLLEDTNTLEVKVNESIVNKIGTVLEKDLWKYDVSSLLRKGKNEVIIKIHFFEKDNVYYALFDPDATETVKNCLVYDTTIEAIYLRGDFGVFGDFTDGEHEDIVIANKFYIDKANKEIKSLIKDGYPFFRGTIKLKQNIHVDDTNKVLLIDKRFQLIDLYVNDVFVKRMMFDYKVDISNYLKVGDNEIKLELVVSNRNILGPHHTPSEEELFVGPYIFELFNTWDKEGKSSLFLERYTFVKTII